jgi:hypothetical protein
MILRLVGVQLDSGLLSQGSGDPSSGLVRSVRAIIGQAISNGAGETIAWTDRQNKPNLQGTVAQDGQSEQWPSLMDADDTSDTANANSAGASSGWNGLDAAAKYMFYTSIFAVLPHSYLLNVFA